MSRWFIAFAAALAVTLCAPLAAEARTPCPNETLAPNAANVAQVNDAIFCLTNQIRAHYSLPALRRDSRLDLAATLHSIDMGTRLFFDHVNPDGLNPGARAKLQGYTLGVGENIAYGYANARSVMLGWMASEGHCHNILSSAIDFGVGTAVIGTPHYTQEFGDYFSRPLDQTARNACPYTIDLDTMTVPDKPVTAAPGAGYQDYVPDDDDAPGAGAATKLTLRKLSVARTRFRAGRGTTVSYTLSAPAAVTFRVERSMGNGRYKATSARLTQVGAAGANKLRFTGRVGGRTLRPGRYRLQAVGTDATGASSKIARVRFAIVGR
jgi:uncharacterized protein YkwD